MTNNVNIKGDFVINEQPDIQADFYINITPDISDLVTKEELQEDLSTKQDSLIAGEGISIVDNVISNTQTSAEWGNVQGDIQEQTDLIDLIDTKIDIEATARENNDLLLQNGINTLNDDLTSEISNRGTADGILQNNIDTLSGTVTSNYNTLDGKIGDNKTAIDNHIADKTNPHEVTKSQVGLGNVDNTSDLNKPISTATQNALNTKVSNTRKINGYALSSDITLTSSDVGALPDTTTINDLTTQSQQDALNSGANSTNIGQIATNTQAISTEVTNRQNADNALQSQIDALVVASDVFDIVGTYAELQAYDISTVPVNDIIKVLVDSTHNNAATYYRCVENDNVKSWSYIGAEGAYYTKSEADNRFVEQTTTINGQALSSNITLDAEDVGAMPDTTTIGNGTLTIQKNGSTIDTFAANDTGNTTVNITVPTDTIDLTNNAGFITGIDSSDVTTALGYTPYNSTNPDGYTDNVGTVTSVNNTQPDNNGNVTLSIPAQTDVKINNTSITNNGVANIVTNTAYDSSSNKIATMSDVPTVDSSLSTTSENPVQNKIITNALDDKQDELKAGDGIAITDVSDSRSTASLITVGSARWQDVTYGNNIFVAVGNDGYISYSSDGTTWSTPVQVGSNVWYSVTYGNSKFVAVGANGYTTTSTDGVTWTTPVQVSLNNGRLSSVRYGNGVFVAVGYGSRAGYTTTSTDGVTWTSIVSINFQGVGLVFNDNKFIACGTNGDYGTISISTDGVNWSDNEYLRSTTDVEKITYGDGLYVAVSSRKISTSTTGESWTTQTVSGFTCKNIAYGNGVYVVSGKNSNRYATIISTDGLNWKSIEIIGESTPQYGFISVTYGDGKFVAVGDNGATMAFTINYIGLTISSPVDDALSSTSENPVQNKVITQAIGDIETLLHNINSGSST